MNSSNTDLKKLAQNAMQFSHSPYSNKKIGASLMLSNGQVYSGCNIENASYGGTVCAERVAIWKAFSENKADIKIQKMFVASAEDSPWPPCGFCRQVIAEFATPETEIVLVNLDNAEKRYLFKDLFPESFGPAHMK